MSAGKVVVVGASGMVGSAALKHFTGREDWEVVGVSRKFPPNLSAEQTARFEHVSVDLTDPEACRSTFGKMDDVTHVVYAAVYEKPADVVEGWQAKDQMKTNREMLVNFFEPLAAASDIQHVTLMQGTKAYGVHTCWPERPFATPAKESEPRHQHDNFYWLQEDYIRERSEGAPWSWTIWRPQLIFGDPVGSNLSVISVLGAYAALEREAGRPLSYPGGPAYPLEAIDVDLLADAIGWGATAEGARNETFNITNGDIYVWENIWPAIADACSMEVGDPAPQSLLETMPAREEEWAAIVDKYDLKAPSSLAEFIGGSTALTDFTFAQGFEGTPPPVLVSTIKLRQAGFGGCIDTEEMFRKWIDRLQELRYIPAA